VILNHCHVGPPAYARRLEGEGTTLDFSLEALGRYVGELGFDRAVVFAPFAQWFDGDPNAWLLDAVRGEPRFIPWVTINGTGPAAAAALAAALRAGARGVKFHPPVIRVAINDPGLEAFYGLAAEARVPVLYHTGTHGWYLNRYHPLLVDEVAQRHPKLPLIIEHLGGMPFLHETEAVLDNNPNVLAGLATCLPPDASWHVPADAVRRLVTGRGADRFVFGADFPYNPVEKNREAIRILGDLNLPAADLPLILSGNLERLDANVAAR